MFRLSALAPHSEKPFCVTLEAATRANGVTVALGAGGTLSITYIASSSAARTQAIFDVTGYFD
jgi:hypothetical protein